MTHTHTKPMESSDAPYNYIVVLSSLLPPSFVPFPSSHETSAVCHCTALPLHCAINCCHSGLHLPGQYCEFCMHFDSFCMYQSGFHVEYLARGSSVLAIKVIIYKTKSHYNNAKQKVIIIHTNQKVIIHKTKHWVWFPMLLHFVRGWLGR